jgi:GrpB-like predicted nucleotidyltransferase (UPF0157 family)
MTPAAGLSLLGAEARLPDDDPEAVLAFYGPLFADLPAAVPPSGELTRLLAFQAPAGDGATWHRFGIEAPPERATWDLRPPAVHWDWTARDTAGRTLGGYRLPDGRAFEPTGAAYVAPGGPAADDAVELADYDPAWRSRFEALASWLGGLAEPDLIGRIEHYGSTAVPGLGAKPVIDLLVEVPSFVEARRRLLPKLLGPAVEFWWYDGHLVVVGRERPLGRRAWHLHLAPIDQPVWRGLAFRDWLRGHPEDAARYAALKRELAAAHGADRERYTLAKGEFVGQVTRRAAAQP